MNIGQAASATGVSAKLIRYYESIALIPPSARRESGYRDYARDDVHRLAFIKRARRLGFSIDQIRELLRLWSDHERSNAEVKAIALAHMGELERRARELQEMTEALAHLASACDGDGRPHCPIIEGLESGEIGAAAPDAAADTRIGEHSGNRLTATRNRRNPVRH